jgi:hypothetical protein
MRFVMFAAAKPVVAAAAKPCQNATAQTVDGQSRNAIKPLLARPLGEEPAASRYLPVLRMVDGCDLPVKIGDHKEGGDRPLTPQTSSTSRP